MAESTPTEAIEEKKDPTELSIGKIVAWLVGAIVLLAGVANIVQATIGAGIMLIIAGLFGLPPTRRMIEDELNVRLSRWLAVIVFLALLVIAGGLTA